MSDTNLLKQVLAIVGDIVVSVQANSTDAPEEEQLAGATKLAIDTLQTAGLYLPNEVEKFKKLEAEIPQVIKSAYNISKIFGAFPDTHASPPTPEATPAPKAKPAKPIT